MRGIFEFAGQLLVLGRVSNLPTVWSNSLAAWFLVGGVPDTRLLFILTGGSLFYTGGMFLNDVFDAKFDSIHRPERPIPSGNVSLVQAFAFGMAQVLAGAGIFFLAGAALPWILGLTGLILIYNATHKNFAMAPIVMAGCRLALILSAASAAKTAISSPLLVYGAALFFYVAGVGFLARSESKQGPPPHWPFLLVAASSPFLLALSWPLSATSGLAVAALLLWGIQAFRFTIGPQPSAVAAVGRLLAGLPLLDALAVACTASPILTGLFFILFLLARLLQTRLPST